MRAREMPAISSTAERKAASLTCDGFVKPQIFRTNCRDAARISSSVTGGSKLNSVLMLLHMSRTCGYNETHEIIRDPSRCQGSCPARANAGGRTAINVIQLHFGRVQ